MIGRQIKINAPKLVEKEDDENGILYTYGLKYGVAFAKALDDEIIKTAYDKYKELGFTDVVLLDENEFGHFLKEMLPLWVERHGK